MDTTILSESELDSAIKPKAKSGKPSIHSTIKIPAWKIILTHILETKKLGAFITTQQIILELKEFKNIEYRRETVSTVLSRLKNAGYLELLRRNYKFISTEAIEPVDTEHKPFYIKEQFDTIPEPVVQLQEFFKSCCLDRELVQTSECSESQITQSQLDCNIWIHTCLAIYKAREVREHSIRSSLDSIHNSILDVNATHYNPRAN